NSGAPKLSLSEAFVENPGRERHCDRRTKELQGLRQRDPDLAYRNVIQNMGKCDAGHSGNHQNEVRRRACVDRRVDLAKRQGKRTQQARSDETDNSKAANRPKFSGGPFNQNTIEGPTKGRSESDK